METLNIILPVLLYVAGFILLIVLIILGIRLIQILNKVDRVVDNVEEKVNSLNPAFDFVSKATGTLATVGESFVGAVASIFSKIFNRKPKSEEEYYE